MNAVMGNLSSAAELIKALINLVKEFFQNLFSGFGGGEDATA